MPEDVIAPVPWVRRPALSRWVARLLRPRQPSVLVLSLPRSGSSWVGEALGCAVDALYLREPVTQSNPMFYQLGTVFPINRPDVAASYQASADKAFAGLPDFKDSIVRFSDQWALTHRRSRRVVIKEVNPLASSWYIERYAPRIVFLVRHPCAVALSWQRKGWLGEDAESWARNGEHQGHALREAMGGLAKYAALRVVVYEELCADPVGAFKPLFDFAGLTWEAQAQGFIAERTRQDDENNPWQTSRNSQEMIHGWRNHVGQVQSTALGRAFGEFDLPWYRDAQDWVVPR